MQLFTQRPLRLWIKIPPEARQGDGSRAERGWGQSSLAGCGGTEPCWLLCPHRFSSGKHEKRRFTGLEQRRSGLPLALRSPHAAALSKLSLPQITCMESDFIVSFSCWVPEQSSSWEESRCLYDFAALKCHCAMACAGDSLQSVHGFIGSDCQEADVVLEIENFRVMSV